MSDNTRTDNLTSTDELARKSAKYAHFIACHAQDDVRSLALQGHRRPDIDMPYVLDQIAGRQRARQKLPTWAATEGIVYPPHLNMEQCSGELTARYKAQLAVGGSSLVDLTGGLGVDCHFMGQSFSDVTYVERNATLCRLARHNFDALGDGRFSVVCRTAEEHLSQMGQAELIYLDPSRRDTAGRRTYGIADCTPNLATLLDTLFQHTGKVMVKLSPMLDWHEAVMTDAEGRRRWPVTDIHIVSVDNECKELIWLLQKGFTGTTRVTCVNLSTRGDGDPAFCFDCRPHPLPSVRQTAAPCPPVPADTPRFLYEPNASIMKAGCFEAVARQYGITPLAANSHLMVSTGETDVFPGRKFLIAAISSMNKRELRTHLQGATQANIATRNFPMSVAGLRRQLRLRDGGDLYLFATTLADGRHVIFFCHKTTR